MRVIARSVTLMTTLSVGTARIAPAAGAATHGLRNVPRLDPYERRPAPPVGPAASHVLDRLVQSKTVAGK